VLYSSCINVSSSTLYHIVTQNIIYVGIGVTLKMQNQMPREERGQMKASFSGLTIEQVCPIWYKKLKSGLNENDKSTMRNDSKYCMVGEAWGFTGRQTGYYIAPLMPFVGCWTCVTYGRKFGNLAKKNYSQLHSYQPLISDFIKHWNEKHIDITKKLRKNINA
jgi:hypothetical protein